MAIDQIKFNKLPGGLRNLYTRAQDAFNKKNYDYTVALLNGLIQVVPGFYDARELLRKAEILRTEKLDGFTKFTANIKSQIAVFQGKMNLKKNPKDSLNFAEEALANIYSEAGLQLFFESADAIGAQDLAIDALERILKLKPDDEGVIKKMLAYIEGKEGFAVRRLQLRQKLVALHPKDLRMQSELRAATAEATMEMNAQNAAKAEEEKAVASRDNGTNAPDLSDLERGDRIIRSVDDIKEMISRYEQVVAAGKGTVDVLRKLAEFYQKADMHEKAIETFQTLAEKQGTKDITVGKAIEKSTVAIHLKNIEQMTAEGKPQEEIDAAKQTLLQYQIETGKQRKKDFPGDLQVNYELALVYFEGGMYDEAAKEFKAAAKNPQRKLQAETYIGRAYMEQQKYDQAVELFKKLLGEMAYMDNQKMRTLYYLGNTYELMGNRTEAAYTYREIAAHNKNYQDVADKVQQFADIPEKVEETEKKPEDEEEA